jgi:hypothetical protein
MKAKTWLKSEMPIQTYETDLGWPSSRKQRLFAVACCCRLLRLLPEGRWHDCVSIAERYADRRAKRDELAVVCPRVQREMAYDSKDYAHVVKETAEIAVLWLCETHKRNYAAQVASYALSAVAYSALPPKEPNVPPAGSHHHARRWENAAKAEREAQIGLLEDVCGNQFREVKFSPSWRTGTVVALARQMYEAREFSAMPILADALQDVGCDNEDVLAHCRGPGPHVRGCWVVDLVLDKA